MMDKAGWMGSIEETIASVVWRDFKDPGFIRVPRKYGYRLALELGSRMYTIKPGLFVRCDGLVYFLWDNDWLQVVSSDLIDMKAYELEVF